MTHHDRGFAVNQVVTVGDDDFTATLILSRPAEPVLERDMEVIKAAIVAELPTWLEAKIQAGETAP